jgi:uncharacterized membrane protein YkoI
MQKILLTLALLGVSNAQTLTLSEVSKLRNYGHSISAKMRYKRLLQKTAIIKKDEAYTLAEKVCQSDVSSAKLLVHANRLFYLLKTEKGTVKIDALDAEIIEKCNG